jgi:hypothetical protein
MSKLDEVAREILVLACQYTKMTDPEAVFAYEDKGIIDYISLQNGWVCRVFPALEDGSSPIMVPDVSGVKETIEGATVALNMWLTCAVGQMASRGLA